MGPTSWPNLLRSSQRSDKVIWALPRAWSGIFRSGLGKHAQSPRTARSAARSRSTGGPTLPPADPATLAAARRCRPLRARRRHAHAERQGPPGVRGSPGSAPAVRGVVDPQEIEHAGDPDTAVGRSGLAHRNSRRILDVRARAEVRSYVRRPAAHLARLRPRSYWGSGAQGARLPAPTC